MIKIENPILKGFNPDPSICRVGDDYYIATSTFEWFPGVQIHHSKDLKNWKLISRPLNRLSQLNMIGNPDSGGIWAPCLTYCDNKFWLIYTDVKMLDGIWKDAHNYLVTCDTIDGEWSEPIYLNSKGFDPSLFHDDDGRKYLMNMVWDHRTNNHPFYGIMLQEYSTEENKLIGKAKTIFKGTDIKLVEAPHIYKKDGYYYLVVAEGGTQYEHAITVARSKDLWGEYEVHPNNPMLTSYNNPKNPLQKAGHGSFVQAQNGQWYVTHLVGRPLTERGYCPLGRETAIQEMVWNEGDWPYIKDGNEPKLTIEVEGMEEIPQATNVVEYDDFNNEELNIHFQTLRVPLDESVMTLKERPGYLRLYGKSSLNSRFVQSLVARRWQNFKFTAQTGLEFEPDTFQQTAGLVCYYNTENWMYLNLSYDEVEEKRVIDFIQCDNMKFTQPYVNEKIYVDNNIKQIHFKVDVDCSEMKFAYSFDKENWTYLDIVLEADKLSDDYVVEHGNPGFFTGAFVGMCCQDMTGNSINADFDYFIYKEL